MTPTGRSRQVSPFLLTTANSSDQFFEVHVCKTERSDNTWEVKVNNVSNDQNIKATNSDKRKRNAKQADKKTWTAKLRQIWPLKLKQKPKRKKDDEILTSSLEQVFHEQKNNDEAWAANSQVCAFQISEKRKGSAKQSDNRTWSAKLKQFWTAKLKQKANRKQDDETSESNLEQVSEKRRQ